MFDPRDVSISARHPVDLLLYSFAQPLAIGDDFL